MISCTIFYDVFINVAAISCNKPNDIEHASYDSDADSNVGDKLLINCDDGYIVNGTNITTSFYLITCLLQPDELTADWSEQVTCTGKVKFLF
jgi:hypothetical protein